MPRSDFARLWIDKTWTQDDLAALTRLELSSLHRSAKRLIETIENSGLDYSRPQGLLLESPLGRAMRAAIESDEGRRAAIEATDAGQAALAGIDPLLQRILGPDYENTYESTIQAGYLTAKMMRRLGYEDFRKAKLPEGCIATSGIVFKKTPK